MIFYIKIMICIILTGIAFAVLKTLLETPIYRIKHSLKFNSFRRKIGIGSFTEEELLIIKNEVEKALTIQGYINEFADYEE